MFVRNNTTCPNCGNCKVFDFVVDESSDTLGWCMQIACIGCEWKISIDSSLEGLRLLFQGLVRVSGWRIDDDSNLVRLWNRSLDVFDNIEDLVAAELKFVRYMATSVVRPNVVHGVLSESGPLSKVISYFVERPERKRRFRWDLLLRTVGL